MTTYDYFQRASQLLKPEEGRWKVRRIVIIGNARSNVAEVARFDDQ